MRQRQHRLRPADPVEPGGGEQMVGYEERVEAQLLRSHRKPTDLIAVLRCLAREEVRRDENSELHAEASAASPLSSSSPAKTSASRMRSRSASEMGRRGGRTVSRSMMPCITSAALARAL